MPHTTSQSQSRKKKRGTQPQKRITVTDENGWSHVTTEGNLKRTVKKATTTVKDGGEQQLEESSQSQSQSQSQSRIQLQLRPAEAPKGLNIDGLRRQFQSFREKWESSTANDALHGSLRRAAAAAATSVDRDVTINIICLGLGSPSGFLRDGWVDRRTVSMYQLAALTSIMAFYESGSAAETQLNDKNHRPTITPRVYAQDPVFNALDRSLLHSLGITVIEHPAAFDMVKSQHAHERVFLFCPGAERAHVEQLIELSPSPSPSQSISNSRSRALSSSASALAGPALLFGGPLEEHDDSGVLKTFLDTRESVRIPTFEPCEHAFWNMRLYWLTG